MVRLFSDYSARFVAERGRWDSHPRLQGISLMSCLLLYTRTISLGKRERERSMTRIVRGSERLAVNGQFKGLRPDFSEVNFNRPDPFCVC